MPPLGSSEGPPPQRRRATAYAYRGNVPLPYLVIAALVSLFILKNILFTDYRTETIDALKQAGRSEQEIERFVPKTAAERAQYVKDKKTDYERLKQDVAFLLSEVSDLKERVEGISDGNHSTTSETETDNEASKILSHEKDASATKQ